MPCSRSLDSWGHARYQGRVQAGGEVKGREVEEEEGQVRLKGLEAPSEELVLRPHHVRRPSVLHLRVMREGRGGLARGGAGRGSARE